MTHKVVVSVEADLGELRADPTIGPFEPTGETKTLSLAAASAVEDHARAERLAAETRARGRVARAVG